MDRLPSNLSMSPTSFSSSDSGSSNSSNASAHSSRTSIHSEISIGTGGSQGPMPAMLDAPPPLPRLVRQRVDVSALEVLPGPRVALFDELQNTVNSDSEPLSGMRLLLSKIHEWWTLSQSTSLLLLAHSVQMSNNAPDLHLPLTNDQSELVAQFLDKLTDTADYTHSSAKINLAHRVMDMLQAMSEDSDFCTEALELIEEGVTRCGDRTILVLNRIELKQRILSARQADDPDDALLTLAKRIMKWEVVHQCALKTCQRIKEERDTLMLDEVEIFISYETKLRKELDLPVSTRHMLYNAQVKSEEYREAAESAKSYVANPANVQRYLDQWAPWQQRLRQKEAEAIQWASLPVAEQQPDTEACCPFTLLQFSQIEEPVAIGESILAMPMQALLHWWVDQGVDPVSKAPFELGDVVRFS